MAPSGIGRVAAAAVVAAAVATAAAVVPAVPVDPTLLLVGGGKDLLDAVGEDLDEAGEGQLGVGLCGGTEESGWKGGGEGDRGRGDEGRRVREGKRGGKRKRGGE